MITYDIYGIQAGSMEEICMRIEELLSIDMVAHESSFMGDYYLGKSLDEEFEVRNNRDLVDGERVRDDLPDTAILLYISRTKRAEELEKKLTGTISGLRLLRRTEK